MGKPTEASPKSVPLFGEAVGFGALTGIAAAFAYAAAERPDGSEFGSPVLFLAALGSIGAVPIGIAIHVVSALTVSALAGISWRNRRLLVAVGGLVCGGLAQLIVAGMALDTSSWGLSPMGWLIRFAPAGAATVFGALHADSAWAAARDRQTAAPSQQDQVRADSAGSREEP